MTVNTLAAPLAEQPDDSSVGGRYLRLVTETGATGNLPSSEPVISAATSDPACPAWCSLDHDRHAEGDRSFHYSAYTYAGPVGLCLDLDSDDHATIELRTDDAEGDHLDLTEVDELIAVLTKLRPVLATTTIDRCAPQHSMAQRCAVPPGSVAAAPCVPGSRACFQWCTNHRTDSSDPFWQICFDDGPGLDFRGRVSAQGGVGNVRMWVSFSHPRSESPRKSGGPILSLTVNDRDAFDLEEEQIEPFACLLLAQLAVIRGDDEGARVLRKRITSLMPPAAVAAA